ncbi:MAG TPA: S8 family serine peptidase, partial [Micromonosporaceae bacterium]
MTTTSRRWLTTMAATVAAIAIPLSMLAAAPAVADPIAGDGATARKGTAKIERKVRDQIAKKGTASFWVVLDSEADLTGAARLKDKTAKARFVLTAKTRHAKTTQAGLRALLDRHHAEYRSFWIDNSLLVTGDADLLAEIAARPEVEGIEGNDPVILPDPLPGENEPPVNSIEWNVARINAPLVWTGLGVRGEGIVVANIDTGVKYDHAAVATQYRGRNADGTYNHNYNWFDPARICSAGTPCDNDGHGTHTMGTMVGDDGGSNQIGVAPGTTWIAAKGCESSSCSRTSLLASGQWIVAPTDLTGQNPRPDLAPDVVNNSWGSYLPDDWYQETVQSWISAGIFPAFANGNNGEDGCSSTGSPGGYVISYSAGAFDINNAIAPWSSRGPGENGDIKPNIAAPGVNVRSSTPSGYASYSGTSMASPHLAATVALMWSASPAIQGDIAATRQLLDDTAIDVNNTTCGGTTDDNNVFGEGRLDAYAAVLATPRGALGALNGTVTASGSALAGASVSVSGPMNRTTTTTANGTYSFDRLMVGDYTISVSRFGYQTGTGAVTIMDGQTTIRDFSLAAVPSATLSGVVRLTSGDPAVGATLRALGTPVSAVTDAQGRYQMTLPFGDYQIEVTPTNRCATGTTVSVSLSADMQRDVTLPQRTDSAGYSCDSATGGYVPGTQRLPLYGDDSITEITLPFQVSLYGDGHSTASVSTNGWISFEETYYSPYANTPIPNPDIPNSVLYPLWDDLYVDSLSGVYTGVTGTAPNRTFIVEWRNVSFYADASARVSFEAMISESGVVTFHYAGVDNVREAGGYATVGLENSTGTVAFQYSYNEAVLSSGTGIRFQTDAGIVRGLVTDANDGDPVAGAAVTVRAGGQVVTTTSSNATGGYVLLLRPGGYQITVAKPNYETASSDITIEARTEVSHATALRTGRVEVSTEAMTVVVPTGERRDRTVTLSNTGSASVQYEITESDEYGQEIDVPWLSVNPAAGTTDSGGTATVTVGVNTAALPASSVHGARLLLRSTSGRRPLITIPVTLVVSGYQVALDSGGASSVVDSYGDTWSPDRAYTTGSAGYLGQSHTISTRTDITGTEDDSRFQTQREGMSEYRFDGLADGVYTVELDFAELRIASPDQRYFDIHIEGVEVLSRVDVAYEAGSFGAMNRTLTVQVTDGQLNVRFFAYRGFGTPIVNAIRVTERPDLT